MLRAGVLEQIRLEKRSLEKRRVACCEQFFPVGEC